MQELAREGDWLVCSAAGTRDGSRERVQEQKVELSSLMKSKAKETSRMRWPLRARASPGGGEGVSRQEPQMKYDFVDRIEGYRVSMEELQLFVQDAGSGAGRCIMIMPSSLAMVVVLGLVVFAVAHRGRGGYHGRHQAA